MGTECEEGWGRSNKIMVTAGHLRAGCPSGLSV